MSTFATMRRGFGILLVGALIVLASGVQADPMWRQSGSSEAAVSARAGGQCVRDTEWMRRNHMGLIQHDRDLTVIQGIRTIDGSLAGCVSCHANKDANGAFLSVNAEDQFCAGCHEYAAVSLDCFQCHATVPTK